MTTEDEFQALLDANPKDHLTRLVFADWLEEGGDPRAEGYRALGVGRFCPRMEFGKHCPYWANATNTQCDPSESLPLDWYTALEIEGKDEQVAPRWSQRNNATRAELEDAAAIAFSRLPPERRVELLAPPAPETGTKSVARARKRKKPKPKAKRQNQKKPKGKK